MAEQYNNNVVEIRRTILKLLAKLIIKDELEEKIDRLPFEMYKKDTPHTRCCVHKARAVAKYMTMATLGYNIDDEKDEFDPLSHYVHLAKQREESTEVMLTVVDEACSSCVKSSYIVTNLCRSCTAHPCTYACKKGAMTKHEHEQAHIDTSKCINCGLCMQACPYHAIIFQPVPCEEACPVGAISKGEDGVEHIDPTKCIYCGKCKIACPFGAISEKSFMFEIMRDIRLGKEVIAMVAPSLGGQFKEDYGKVLTAIKKLGFTDVVEVAKGANVTTEVETKEFLERMEEGAPFMTTSCCSAWRNLVQKHIPEMAKYVSTTLTPMAYTAKWLRETKKDAIIVMVSPCVGKRSEAHTNPDVNYVLSYEELDALFWASEMDIESLEPTVLDSTILGHGRGFAMIAGVTASVKATAPDPSMIHDLVIDGLSKQNIRQLKLFAQKGEAPANFIEVMSCPGGCVNGCDTINNPKTAARQILPTTK
ncbi:MAG: monomeric [FeFe] hydrogenase [Bacteroidales bacterium]|nr:monomeric [FeFe] hydrogenase [Candidatus Scybalousia scybalohippi]MCQ2327303.1 monomeric [FeFe] hydrogenase [Bacteroidales bacterium]